jgi:hypothetical protein
MCAAGVAIAVALLLPTGCGGGGSTFSPPSPKPTVSANIVKQAALAITKARTGQFESVLAGAGIEGFSGTLVHQYGTFDRSRSLLEIRLILESSSDEGITPGTVDQPNLLFLYAPSGVLMRNKSFDAIVHKPWVRFTPEALRKVTTLPVDLNNPDSPMTVVAATASGNAVVQSDRAGTRELRVMVSRAACIGLLGNEARTLAAKHQFTGTLDMTATIDNTGRLVRAVVDLVPLVQEIATLQVGSPIPVPVTAHVTYSTTYSQVGKSVTIAVPAESQIAPAPNE